MREYLELYNHMFSSLSDIKEQNENYHKWLTKEYDLIMQKKSKLSSMKRAKVIKEYNEVNK